MRFPRVSFLTAVMWAAFTVPVHAANVEGKVSDANGKPVAGASVALLRLSRLSVLTGQVPKPEMLQTDANGEFTLDLPDDDFTALSAQDFQGVAVRARVQANGYALADTMLKKGTNAITLKPPATVRGTVIDDKGAPVAGVRVRWAGLQTPEIQDSAIVTVVLSEGLPSPETQTGADGSFTLPGSGVGTRSVIVLDDPRFQRQILAASPDGDKISLVARPAAVLKGRLVTPEGEGIPDVTVLVMQEEQDIRAGIFTDKDGRFEVGSLPGGRVRVMPQVPSGDWTGALKTVEGLKAGETRDLGDWKLSKGVEVTGQLVDQDTGQPVTSVAVMATGFVQRPVPVDNEGKFRLKSQAGPSRLMIMTNNAPYMNSLPPLNVPEGVPSVDLGKIKMQRGDFLEGTAVAEGGESVAGLQIFVMQQGGNGGYKNTTIDKDGRLKLGPLAPGKYVIQVVGGPEWEVQEPKEVTVAAVGQAQPTLNLKLKKQPALPARGRVVDTRGIGVPGARVRIAMRRERDGQGTEQNIDTGADGWFNLPSVVQDFTPSLVRIERDGYEVKTKGKATKGAEAWTFSDTIMATCDATLQGRVLDAAGKPAVGALLLDSRSAVKAKEPQKLESGEFSLSQLPEGNITVLAALGREYGIVTAKTGEPAQVALKAPAKLRQEQIDALLFDFPRKQLTTLLQYRDLLGDDRLLDLALRLDASQAGGPMEDASAGDNVGEVLANVARRDPAKAATWCLQQLERFPQLKSRDSVLIPIGIAIAMKGDDAARASVKLALKEKNVPLPGAERTSDNARRWFALAVLASLLDDYHVDEYMNMGFSIVDFVGKKEVDQHAGDWGRALAPGGLKWLGRLEDEWKPDVRFAALSGAAATLAQFHPDEASDFMKQLTALAADPAVKAADVELAKSGEGWRNSTRNLDRARVSLAADLAETNLEGALAIVQTVSEPWQTGPAYQRIVENALAQGKTDVATKAIEAGKSGSSQEQQAYFAALAKSWNPKLSDEIFDGLQTSARQSANDVYSPSLASYAFYRAPYDPAQSRLILESEWLRHKGATGNDREQDNAYLAPIAGAMVALDPARALEMLNESPDQWGSKERPRAQILAYLLSSSPARDLMPPVVWNND